MERHEELIQTIRNGINNLQEFLRNLQPVSLNPPLPPRVYYALPETMEKARLELENLRLRAIELQDEVDDLTEDLENPRR